jgi:SNF2 family DNA or RNA helicase
MNIDCGLGKTIITLNALDALLAVEAHKVLIIAPLRVARDVWPEEIKKWSHLQHLKISPIVGDKTARVAAARTEADIYTVNYENVPWLYDFWKSEWPYTVIVADESTKLKSCRSSVQVSKHGKKFIRADGGARTSVLSKIAFNKAQRWINLTGGFSPNGLEMTWGQLWFIDAGKRLGRTYTDFTNRWFKVGFNGFGLTAMTHAEGEIQEKIRDVTFTLRAEDYLELPKEIFNKVFVDLPPQAMVQYRSMEEDFYVRIKAGEVEAFTAAVKTGKIHQMANGAIYYDKDGSWEPLHDAKLDALKDIIEEAGGMPVIVAYKFRSDLERLKKAFPEAVQFDNKSSVKEAFLAGRIPILLLHPGSAGHGVDGLQAVTNILIFFSLDWNVEERLQTIARIGAVRQFQAGMDRPVIIHQIIARRTVDEDILDRIENRLSVEESLKLGMARRNLR